MIRSERDFLDNLLGAVDIGRKSKMDPGQLLGKVEEMVRNRLEIYSGKQEPNWDVRAVFVAPPKEFVPVEVRGKPLSEMIVEDRR